MQTVNDGEHHGAQESAPKPLWRLFVERSFDNDVINGPSR